MSFLGVYGHVNVDYILEVETLPGEDQTVPVQRELMRLGGTGGNIARAAQSLGVPTALAAYVGDDFPPQFRQSLAESGIELVDLRHVPGPTPKIWILTTKSGKQSGVIEQGVMGDGLERPRLDYTMLGAQWVHFTTGPPDLHYVVARDASKAGKKVSFDPAQETHYRWSDRTFERFLDESDVFFCNEAELARALEKLNYGDPRQLLDHTDAVVVTRGAQGVELLRDKKPVKVPACPLRSAAPADTVGAGDVFRAGTYAGLHAGQALESALRWGAAAAALYLESGSSAFPRRDALSRRLAEWRT
jgi:sugar/nucleoside kinase (ribokinase family)